MHCTRHMLRPILKKSKSRTNQQERKKRKKRTTNSSETHIFICTWWEFSFDFSLWHTDSTWRWIHSNCLNDWLSSLALLSLSLTLALIFQVSNWPKFETIWCALWKFDAISCVFLLCSTTDMKIENWNPRVAKTSAHTYKIKSAQQTSLIV